MNPPSDLVPLPTMPYDKRPAELPLDVEECRTALWRAAGNITKAAEILKVPSQRLRYFIKNSPRLSAEVEEAREQIVDVAEENVMDALQDQQDPGRRDSMTRFVLGSIGRSRGYGAGASVNIKNSKGATINIQWANGESIGPEKQPGDDAKVINHDS